jgi:hypothetical protein
MSTLSTPKSTKLNSRQHNSLNNTLKDFDFQHGSLILIRNTQIEKSLNKKICARYIGPLIVVSCNYGGAYILSELDGVVNGVLLPSIALNCLPGCYTRMFNCSGILD